MSTSVGGTEFPLNDALAVQLWSSDLAVEAEVLQYFKKFMGESADSMWKVRKELTKQAGEKITYALRMKIGGDAAEGDDIIEGTDKEVGLDFYNDAVFINQRRKTVKSKGQMSEQRVPYSMRKEGKDALAVYFAEDYDQFQMMYLAGARGIDTTFHVPLTFTGRANNELLPPDSSHIIAAGNATLTTATRAGIANQYYSSDMDSADTIDCTTVERLVAKSETTDPAMQPFMIDGEKRFVLLMHTYQAYYFRTETSDNDWLEIHKATDGKDSPIYQNALGEYAGVILHKHRNVIRFSDYGSGSIAAARALFLGAQAGTIAWGGAQAGVGRYSWNEEKDDRGNALAVTSGSIWGCKKNRYNGKDFGVVAVDAYCA